MVATAWGNPSAKPEPRVSGPQALPRDLALAALPDLIMTGVGQGD